MEERRGSCEDSPYLQWNNEKMVLKRHVLFCGKQEEAGEEGRKSKVDGKEEEEGVVRADGRWADRARKEGSECQGFFALFLFPSPKPKLFGPCQEEEKGGGEG